VQERWEDRNDCPQQHNAVADLHVIARTEAPSQSPCKCVMPIAHLSSEVLIIQELFGSTSSGINALSEAMQLSLAAKCLLLVDLLLGVPVSKELEDLVQEASEVLSFPSSALCDNSRESLLVEQLVEQVQSAEARRGVVVHDLDDL